MTIEDFYRDIDMTRALPGLQHGKLIPRNTGGAFFRIKHAHTRKLHYIIGIHHDSTELCQNKEFLKEIEEHSEGGITKLYFEGRILGIHNKSCEYGIANHFKNAPHGFLDENTQQDAKKNLHHYNQEVMRIIHKRDRDDAYAFLKANHIRKRQWIEMEKNLYQLGDLFTLTLHVWMQLWANFGRIWAMEVYDKIYKDVHRKWITELHETMKSTSDTILFIMDWSRLFGLYGILHLWRRENWSYKQLDISGFWPDDDDVELIRLQGIDHARNMERMWLIRSARYGDDDKERHEKGENENKKKLEEYLKKQEENL